MKEFIESHEKEAVDMLMELYDQERITDRMLASTRKEQREETTLENIKNLMVNLKWTAEQAMQALGIPTADQPKYQAKL